MHIDPATLSRVRPDRATLPVAEPRLLRIDDLEVAFQKVSTSATRLILTQSTYTIQKWIDVLGHGDRIIATADRDALRQAAPEAFARRGPWRFFQIVDVSMEDQHVATEDTESQPEEPNFWEAIETFLSSASSVVERLQHASASRDRQDFHSARMALDEALRLAPDWEAVQFEDGKFWLASDDMERARDAFQRAADLMPTFSAAYSNLGAVLGELDQPEAAVAAFTRARPREFHDPEQHRRRQSRVGPV